LQYLETHQAILGSHYSAAFLGQFPTNLQRLDDTTGGISMIDTPDLDRAVFIRALEDIGEVRIPGTGVRIDLRKGDISVIRWSAVKSIVQQGDAELI
jgi:GINS complex subunit 4